MAATGYDVEFAEQLDPRLQTDCIICRLVLKNPCETECCGKYFCKSCLEELRRHDLCCPHCRGKLAWHASQAQERLIKELKVVCKLKSKGCEWVGELGELTNHLNEESSDTSGCQFVLLKCFYCHHDVKRGDLNRHLNFNEEAGRYEGCGLVRLECAYNCGRRTLERRQLEKHESACQHQVIYCGYKTLGCEAKVARKDMPAHVVPETHMQLLLEACIDSQKAVLDIDLTIDQIEKQCSDIEDQHKENMKEMRGKFWDLVKTLVDKNEQLCDNIEDQHKENVRKMQLKLKTLEEQFRDVVATQNARQELKISQLNDVIDKHHKSIVEMKSHFHLSLLMACVVVVVVILVGLLVLV